MKRRLTIAIADDNDGERELLRRQLPLHGNFDLVGEAGNGKELIRLLHGTKPDVLLLDLHMPGLGGLEAVRRFREEGGQVATIVVTGYPQYALEAFGIGAVDYVLKPVEGWRLEQALARASVRAGGGERSVAWIRCEHTSHFLAPETILFIEKSGDRCLIHTTGGELTLAETLAELHRLTGRTLLQSHRSFLINVQHIRRIEHGRDSHIAYFQGCDKPAYISKTKLADVIQALRPYTGKG